MEKINLIIFIKLLLSQFRKITLAKTQTVNRNRKKKVKIFFFSNFRQVF